MHFCGGWSTIFSNPTFRCVKCYICLSYMVFFVFPSFMGYLFSLCLIMRLLSKRFYSSCLKFRSPPISIARSVLGNNTYESSMRYVSDRFLNMVLPEIRQERQIYTHHTNATDTENINRVFDSCIDVVFKRSLEKVGFI